VGVGFGGMGVMFRQVSDVRWGRYHAQWWETKIDGIEVNTEYRNQIWQVYNEIFIGNMVGILPGLHKYDIIFFGDVLEHLEKEEAKSMLNIALTKANIAVIVTTPASFATNEEEAERFANSYEAHQCLIEREDLPPNATVEQYGNQQLIIIEK